MIPDSIKIDNNGDFEIEDVIYGYDHDDHGIKIAINFTFEEIEEAYLLAKSKKHPQELKYGCHIDADKDLVYGDCELDFCAEKLDCPTAIKLQQQGKCKTDCKYWRPVEAKK